MSRNWRRVAAVGGAMMLLAAVLGWRLVGHGTGSGAEVTGSEPVTPQPPAAASSPADAMVRGPSPWAASAASAASDVPLLPPPAAQAQDRAALKQRMQADWCGFGAAEQQRQAEAILERASAGGQPIGLDALAELNRTPGAEVVEAAIAQVRRRWVAALRQRGDPRSLAVAEYLGGVDGDPARARARLQALARTSADPMVTALALQRPCESGGCVNVDRAQWSRLEPANLLAWLTLLDDAAARRTQEVYALERIASEARYSRSYQRELGALLLGLPQTTAQGLAQDAELQLVTTTLAVWPMPGLRPVVEPCRARAADRAVLQRCVAVAELLWQGETLPERSLALSLVGGLAPLRAELLPTWAPRAREVDAAQQWGVVATEQAASAAESAAGPCSGQGEWRRRLESAAALGEWGRIRAMMKEARVDESELAAQWRRIAGRSALDPLPPPAAR